MGPGFLMDIPCPPSPRKGCFAIPPSTLHKVSLLLRNLHELSVAYRITFRLFNWIFRALYLEPSFPLASGLCALHGWPSQGPSQPRPPARC